MTTGISELTEVDADMLESVFLDDVRARPAATPPANGHPTGHVNGHALSATQLAVGGPAASLVRAVDSTPDHAVFARHLGQSLRTAAPLLAADLAGLALAGWAAQAVLTLVYPSAAATVGRAAPVALFPLIVGYWLSGLYSEVWVHPAMELRQSTLATTVALLAVAFAGLWAPPLAVWVICAWLVAVVAIPLARAAARHWCCGREWWGYPTLVIGAGGGGDVLARSLMKSGTSGLRPALVTDTNGVHRTAIVPVVNDPAVLRSIVQSKGIRHAVLCLGDLPAAKIFKAFDQYGGMTSHLLVVCDTPPLPALWGAERVCGLGGVEVRNGLRVVTLRVVKRVSDVAIAAAALCVGLPLLLVIAATVKLTSRGPVLFGHKRIGRHGRRFTAWKFRTMHPGADALLKKHFERVPSARLEWERDQKLRDDPRVTPVGGFLRRFSLDELPQMWNVLRGEMSVVGPRPIVDDEVARYGEAFDLYTAVKPGITGLWQVSGRTDVGYEMRVRLDAFYVRHWSPWLDVYVLARTVVALLCRRGAY